MCFHIFLLCLFKNKIEYNFEPVKNLVVLTGAGISAESGIKTFRDAGGLWEGHSIEEVASPEGFEKNPELVLEFYNARRKQLAEVEPNFAHTALKELEQHFKVNIITQNVDDLHERAGSSHVLHLHGELIKVQSTGNPAFIETIGYNELKLGNVCPLGFQLRPHIVWFGEAVPEMEKAIEITQRADVFLIIGTSLEVYPAASLLDFVPYPKPVFIIDPYRHKSTSHSMVEVIQDTATQGIVVFAKHFNIDLEKTD